MKEKYFNYIKKILDRIWFPISIIVMFSISTIVQFGKTEMAGADTQCNFSDLLEWIDHFSTRLFEECEYPPMGSCLFRLYNLISGNKSVESMPYVQNYMVLMTILFTAIVIYSLLQKLLASKGSWTNLWAFSFFLTTPILWAYHWLNMILYTFICMLIFLLYYESEKKHERIIALIALAFAANIKYYPGIFVLLLLNKKRIRDFIIEGFIMGGMFFCPFIVERILYPDRVSGSLINQVVDIMKFTFSWHSEDGEGWTAKTMTFSDMMNWILEKVHFVNQSDYKTIISILFVIYIIASLVLFYLSKRKDHKLFLLALMCIFVPNWSPYYAMVFFILPFINLVCISDKNWSMRLECLLYFAMFIPLYGWGPVLLMSYNYWHIIILYFIVFINCIIELKKHFSEKRIQTIARG